MDNTPASVKHRPEVAHLKTNVGAGRAHDMKTRPLILVGVVCLLIFEAGVVLAGLPRLLSGDGDFSAFYRTAVMVKSGDLNNLYDLTAQDRLDRQVFPSLERYPPYYFYHPPYEVLWLLPLSLVNYRIALWCWTAVAFALLVTTGLILQDNLRALRRALGFPLAMLVLAFFPVVMIFLQGQDSPILLLLLALAFRQFEGKRDIACGVLLGLGLFKFQFIIPLIAILTFRWRPKLISAFVITTVCLLGVSWTLLGTSGLRLYWQLLNHHTPEMAWRMPNLRGLVESLGGSSALTIALSVCLVLWCGWRVTRLKHSAYPAALVCAMLVSYHGHVYDDVLLLVPILWMLNLGVLERRPLWAFWPALFFMVMPALVVLTLYKITWILALPLLLLLAFTLSCPTPSLSRWRGFAEEGFL